MSAKTSISLKTIAEAAGVSVMTVSHALRNRRNVSTATRTRIQQLAAAMGYRPDPEMARYMAYIRRQRATPLHMATIAFLDYRQPGAEAASTEPYRLTLAGARQRAEEMGYKVEELGAGDARVSPNRLLQILRARGIDSIIIPPLPVDQGHPGLDIAGFYAAAIGFSLQEPQVPRVSHDHFEGITLALREIQSLGYRRPGFIATSASNDRVRGRWLGGYTAYTCNLPEHDRLNPLVARDGLRSREIEHWLASENPDVVLTPHPEVFRILQEAGLRIPDDAGFVLLDTAAGQRTWAGIDQDLRRIGRTAVDAVIARRNNPAETSFAHTVQIPGLWRMGMTVRSVSSGTAGFKPAHTSPPG